MASRSAPDRALRRIHGGHRSLPCLGGAPRRTRLRHRRRRGQGGLLRHARHPGRGRPRPALGSGLQVRSRHGGHPPAKIGVNVGRTGALNPYAVMEPVEVGGVTVSQATLHNEDDIRRKDIREGDWVVIQRADDVIPQVVGPVIQKRTGSEREFRLPDICPSCGSHTVRPEGEVVVRCPNRSCPSQIVESIKHFVSKGAMDIEGVGERLVENLFQAGTAQEPGRPLRAEGKRPGRSGGLPFRQQAGETAAPTPAEDQRRQHLQGPARFPERPFHRVLFALGIRHVAPSTPSC